MVMDGHQILLIKLECRWELAQYLPCGINKLGHDWRHLLGVPSNEPATVRELVAEREPVLLDQCLEAL